MLRSKVDHPEGEQSQYDSGPHLLFPEALCWGKEIDLGAKDQILSIIHMKSTRSYAEDHKYAVTCAEGPIVEFPNMI